MFFSLLKMENYSISFKNLKLNKIFIVSILSCFFFSFFGFFSYKVFATDYPTLPAIPSEAIYDNTSYVIFQNQNDVWNLLVSDSDQCMHSGTYHWCFNIYQVGGTNDLYIMHNDNGSLQNHWNYQLVDGEWDGGSAVSFNPYPNTYIKETGDIKEVVFANLDPDVPTVLNPLYHTLFFCSGSTNNFQANYGYIFNTACWGTVHDFIDYYSLIPDVPISDTVFPVNIPYPFPNYDIEPYSNWSNDYKYICTFNTLPTVDPARSTYTGNVRYLYSSEPIVFYESFDTGFWHLLSVDESERGYNDLLFMRSYTGRFYKSDFYLEDTRLTTNYGGLTTEAIIRDLENTIIYCNHDVKFQDVVIYNNNGFTEPIFQTGQDPIQDTNDCDSYSGIEAVLCTSINSFLSIFPPFFDLFRPPENYLEYKMSLISNSVEEHFIQPFNQILTMIFDLFYLEPLEPTNLSMSLGLWQVVYFDKQIIVDNISQIRSFTSVSLIISFLFFLIKNLQQLFGLNGIHFHPNQPTTVNISMLQPQPNNTAYLSANEAFSNASSSKHNRYLYDFNPNQ